MKLSAGLYDIIFENGGISVRRDGTELYFNRRPVWAGIKDYGGILGFRDQPYDSVGETDGRILAKGRFTTGNGSVLAFSDLWETAGEALRVSRSVTVETAREEDLGFRTRVFFYHALSGRKEDYEYFCPGQWYLDNRYAADYAMGKAPDLQYDRRKETYSGLPMFAMRHKETGETVCLSRWAADATLPSLDRTATENYAYVDPKITVGSFGRSDAKPEALTYTYYGHMIATPLADAQCDGLAIDYVYPGENGQQPVRGHGPFQPDRPLSNIAWVHPVREGFEQHYSVAASFARYDGFGAMMRETWRQTYRRLKDPLFGVDNARLYEDMMRFLKTVTKRFGDAWGTPFVAQLPDFDPDSFSAEIGFVGQQAGIGYQLLRWGYRRNDAEAIGKGLGILNYWTRETMKDSGLPLGWMHLSAHCAEPQPRWIRQIGDGLEAILEAWLLEKKHGTEHPDWLRYCTETGNRLRKMQNADGSWYRSYGDDGEPCMDSKASTPCVIRFLILLKLVTGNAEYLDAALRAGAWCYKHMYLGYEYRGGTCDQSDVMDKESGIYALFAFMALYDATEDPQWLDAARGAADYTETFTFVWSFPVDMPYPCHPFRRNRISGTSNVTVGTGGGDVYMAACPYAYYRLYLLTGDEHYRDFAEFIHKNTKQANDTDGSCGYRYPGLVNEGGFISEQQYRGRYHWLPWCTFVEADPIARFEDTFGACEIDEIEKKDPEELKRRNRIYDDLL